MNNRLKKPKVLAIIGSTGTGKSDLAVHLARRFNGEIINTDAMQMYSGLPIMTNKMPTSEQQGVPHHLLGCIDPLEPAWTVQRFLRAARACIADILSRKKVPVLVGGTHYYVQSLLCADQNVPRAAGTAEQGSDDGGKDEFATPRVVRHPILERPTNEILARLAEVDPAMARRWHPHDRRKIVRSLEIFLDTGRTASEIYAEQREAGVAAVRDDALASRVERLTHDEHEVIASDYDPLILWVHADHAALTSRLDERVIKMLSAGLLDEVRALAEHAATAPASVDDTSGIWQSLGYKQFLPYVQARDAHSATTATADGTASDTPRTQQQQSRELHKMYKGAMEATQAGTRRYAKAQVRWIRIKMLHALDERARRQMFVLDGTERAAYAERVLGKAEAVVGNFLADEALPGKIDVGGEGAMELLVPKAEDMRAQTWEPRHCEACDVTCTNPALWKQHMQSKAHRGVAKAKRKREELQKLNLEGLNPG